MPEAELPRELASVDSDPPQELAAVDYDLPSELIAQEPLPERDASRLLVLERASGARHHGRIADLGDWLRAGDLLVVNATRVLAARLRGRKATGGGAEALLLEASPQDPELFMALVRCGGKLKPGLKLEFTRGPLRVDAEVETLAGDGAVWLRFEPGSTPYALGEAPLPPYIRRSAPDSRDLDRYQTVYAREPGAVAAPTAGLHLSSGLLERLEAAGVERAEVVLHVGAGTFRPIGAAELAAGRLHSERFELPQETAAAIERTRARGGRVVAVGTTTTRVLETCSAGAGRVTPRTGRTDLFLRPGARFGVVDALLTNFHLPRSSLLLLLAAFAGPDAVLAAYRDAVARGYRFFSYGDAMLVL